MKDVLHWMDATWRCVRAVAHWYLTSPVPPALGVVGLVGLLVIVVVEECA